MSDINQHRVEQRVRSFNRIMQEYAPTEPFARFLTRFFKANKQMGSSDRRMASRLCYNYFRLGTALPEVEALGRLTIAEFLCEVESDLVALYQPDWLSKQQLTVEEKIDFIESIGFPIRSSIFPFLTKLSPGIDKDNFEAAHLIQPDLFVRVKRDAVAKVERELQRNAVIFNKESDCGYRLANGTRLQDLNKIKGLYEVQDLSSQQTINFMPAINGQKWWDACAASGGKSLMLLDKFPDIDLLVSDIRLSILRNLDERFLESGIQNSYRKKIIDLTKDASSILKDELFDAVILDVPCSGSGTWCRTPEMMLQIKDAQVDTYVELQKSIVNNALPFLKNEGTLTYITCSVFKAENEDMIDYLVKKHDLIVERTETILGYKHRADTMFAALLRKA